MGDHVNMRMTSWVIVDYTVAFGFQSFGKLRRRGHRGAREEKSDASWVMLVVDEKVSCGLLKVKLY